MGRKTPEEQNPWQQAGLALVIPMMLASGPLVGYGLGWLIRHWTGWGGWVIPVFMALGFAAGVRETIKIIRRIS